MARSNKLALALLLTTSPFPAFAQSTAAVSVLPSIVISASQFPLQADRVGASLDLVPWRMIGPGLWHYPIPLSKGASGDLRLFKVAPGKKLPDHGHRGEELTLLLRGSYHDELGTFEEGDIADLDDEVEHQPVADEISGCICLIASERKARFKGLIARLMQPFIGV